MRERIPANVGGADSGDSTLNSVNPDTAGSGNYDEAVQKAMQAAEEQKRLYEETQKADEAAAQKQAKIQSEMQRTQNEINRLSGGGSGKKPDNNNSDSDKLKSLQNTIEQLKKDMLAAQTERLPSRKKAKKSRKN